jgi:cytochrome c5
LFSLLALLVVPFIMQSCKKQVTGAEIQLIDSSFNAGDVTVGRVIEHAYTVKNIGTAPLKLSKLTTSCGCTAALAQDSIINPNTCGTIKVTFSTIGKGGGFTTKSIDVVSNAWNRPLEHLILRAHLVPDSSHALQMHLTGIFAGQCAICHAERGIGKHGKELFEEDCAMCHSPSTGRNPGPELTRHLLLRHSGSDFSQIIERGISGRNMPAFGRDYGGPLDQVQLTSLVSYLVEVKDSGYK